MYMCVHLQCAFTDVSMCACEHMHVQVCACVHACVHLCVCVCVASLFISVNRPMAVPSDHAFRVGFSCSAQGL